VRTFCVVFGAVSSGELMPDNACHAVVGAVFLLAGLTDPRGIPAGRAG
jgi:hypothetical protein